MKRIIILGMSRSGTSLLYTLLCNSIQDIEYPDDEVSSVAYRGQSERCITKRPLDCFQMEEIFKKYCDDDLKIIFCIRDPRDAICSVHKHVPFDYFMGFQNQYFVDAKRKIYQLSNPGLMQLFNVWFKYKENKNVYTLRYEDLVSDSKNTILELSNFLGEEISAEDFDISDKTKVPRGVEAPLNEVRRIDKKSVGQWKKHPDRIWSEFTQHKQMHELMKQLGYEDSPIWFLKHFSGRLPINIS